MNKLIYTFVATRKKKKSTRFQTRYAPPGIPRNDHAKDLHYLKGFYSGTQARCRDFLSGTPKKLFSDSLARGADSGTKCEQDPTLAVLYAVMALLDKVFGHLSGTFLTLSQ